MKLGKLVLLLAILSVAFSSCTKEDNSVVSEKIDTLTTTYNGSFVNGTFVSTDYDVTVTKVSDTKIKITPEESHGTSFEVNMSEKAGSYLVGDSDVVAFTESNGVYTLSYVHGDETYTGSK